MYFEDKERYKLLEVVTVHSKCKPEFSPSLLRQGIYSLFVLADHVRTGKMSQGHVKNKAK